MTTATDWSGGAAVPVIEVFGPTIQGEGALAGHRTMFIRFGGCDLRCKQCDSMHAVDGASIRKLATYVTPRHLGERLVATWEYDDARAPWVTFSGGNPCLWDLDVLVDILRGASYKIAVETQGTYWKSWLNKCDLVTVSPKGPGMGEKCDRTLLKKFLNSCSARTVLKIVCFEEPDLDLAEELHAEYPDLPLYLSVGNSWIPGTRISLKVHRNCLLETYEWLVTSSLRRPKLRDAIVLPQLHALIWGNAPRK